MRRILGLALTALLFGCAVAERRAPPALPLPAPSALGAPGLADQMVIAQFGDRTLACRSLIRVAADRVNLVCIDALGQRLVGLDWDAQGARVTALPSGIELSPEVIAGEIAATFAGPGMLEGTYRSAGLSVVETATERQIFTGSEAILSITYEPDLAGRWSGRTRLVNRRTGHSIETRSRLVTP